MTVSDAKQALLDQIDSLRHACEYPFDFPEKPTPIASESKKQPRIANESTQDVFTFAPGGSALVRFPFDRFEAVLEDVRKAGKELQLALADAIERPEF